jgi:hypothetical protein
MTTYDASSRAEFPAELRNSRREQHAAAKLGLV